MKHYLNNMNEREKWIGIGGGLCLIIYLLYLFIYSPLEEQVTQKNTLLSEKITTLDWMKKQSLFYSSKIKKSVDNSQLLTLLSTHLKENKQLKFPFQLQQMGNGDVQLTFDAVPFKLFLNWLQEIDKNYNIVIKQLDVDPIQTPGVTRLMIILSSA